MPTHYKGSPAEERALNTYIRLTRANDTLQAHLKRGGTMRALTESQFGTLEALYHLGPLCQGEIGEKILKSSGNMTMVVDNLEKRGLVQRERSREDRRQIEVSLTKEGRQLIESIFPQHAGAIVQAFDTLSASEQEQLGTLCRKLGHALVNEELAVAEKS
ncbi:MAG: MarR family transcriptional regulator [Chloroflexi bacterium]|nr:MAG: MarR family transcriptional regulator [Chloroflexota bacterium]MBL1197345.1 MarR family transcriptional regulator [Chloroflexota bacterium]NOH14642.1 MarR family transcriptional regulator [Chloroflexota bacterium]